MEHMELQSSKREKELGEPILSRKHKLSDLPESSTKRPKVKVEERLSIVAEGKTRRSS